MDIDGYIIGQLISLHDGGLEWWTEDVILHERTKVRCRKMNHYLVPKDNLFFSQDTAQLKINYLIPMYQWILRVLRDISQLID